MVARVTLEIALRREFDYLIPPEFAGRVEVGTGRSNAYEQVGQGIDPRETRERWEEALDMLPKIWQSDEFSYEGKFWNVPPRRILPSLIATNYSSLKLIRKNPTRLSSVARYLTVNSMLTQRQPENGQSICIPTEEFE